MKWPSKQSRRQAISSALKAVPKGKLPLLGLAGAAELYAFSMQIVASLRREDYFRLIQERGPISYSRADPSDPAFEAELGVVFFLQNNQFDEAAWLVFLMVYLAKPEAGWQRLRAIYGKLGAGVWDWATVSSNPASFEQWLAANWTCIPGKFGNHRKYQSLNPVANYSMGPAVLHYVSWIQQSGGHQKHFATIVRGAGNDPNTIFDAFFHALPLKGFGRLGRFDWAAMLARYKFVPAEAGQAYFKGATGPAAGARLLFLGSRTARASDKQLEDWIDELDNSLHVGMEVLEDAICNWQKSPQNFIHFKG